MKDTTIAAIATYPAEAAIGIIRISGKNALAAAAAIFKTKKTFKTIKPGYLTLGHIYDKSEQIDEAMLVLFKAPNSYTGEDMAEFSCHGSPYILSRVMRLLLQNGCEAAGPGEFTKRAFLNGKMDLSEAEAVADLVSAKNSAALKLALAQLAGEESGLIKKLRQKISKLLSLVEAEIDFGHEDIQRTSAATAAALAKEILAETEALIINAEHGIMQKDGIKTALAGRPNTGKSSLLNALLNKNRAIVTSSPGTTRDTVDGSLVVDGLNFRLIDTAGLRQAKNQAEKLGINKTISTIKTSGISIFVIDGSKKPGKTDYEAYRNLKGKTLVVALNKSDKKEAISPAKTAEFFRLPAGTPVIRVSARTKYGIKNLTNALKNIIIGRMAFNPEEAHVASARHKKELEAAAKSLRAAMPALNRNSMEEAAFDLKQAAGHLSSITGEISGEDVLAGIFKNFCIGK